MGAYGIRVVPSLDDETFKPSILLLYVAFRDIESSMKMVVSEEQRGHYWLVVSGYLHTTLGCHRIEAHRMSITIFPCATVDQSAVR